MKKSTKILGALAAGATMVFLWKSSKEKNAGSMNHIKGLNIELNPELLVRSGIELMPIDPTFKGAAQKIASNFIGGYREDEE